MTKERWFGWAVAASVVALTIAGGAWIVSSGSSTGIGPSTGIGATRSAQVATPVGYDPRFARYAGHDQDVVVIVAAAPGRLEVVAAPSDSADLPPGDVAVAVDSQPVEPLSDCGWNCVSGQAPVLQGDPSFVGVEVQRSGRRPARVAIALPARRPPPGTALYRAVNRRMAAIRTVRVDESLGNGTTSVRTRFAFRAPDRMRYEMSTGVKAVVIGDRRWDWQGRRWEATSTEPIRSPAYLWEGARRPWLLGREQVDGRSVRVLTAFRDDPRFPAWFRLSVDDRDRVVRAQMLSVGHFMVDRLSGFDEPVTIVPPH
ncbi:MAG: hypothetical protein ACJ77W_03010 [Chloroflexota bacterium]